MRAPARPIQLAGYLDAGVDANLANQKGDTLVMLAAYHGHAETVRALLERGADPNRANDRGQTPLAGAVFKGEDEVVRALAAGGADPRAGTPSAVATARMFERTDLLELLGRRGRRSRREPVITRRTRIRRREATDGSYAVASRRTSVRGGGAEDEAPAGGGARLASAADLSRPRPTATRSSTARACQRTARLSS